MELLDDSMGLTDKVHMAVFIILLAISAQKFVQITQTAKF